MALFDLRSPALEAYRSAVVPPEDFDTFWQETLAEARTHPLHARFEKIDCGLKLADVYDVTYAGFGGHPVKGWYYQPRAVETGGRCLVRYLGYGGGRGLPHEHMLWPATGRAYFVMDTRGQGRSWSVGDTEDPVGSGPAQKGFMTKGLDRRETYYYRRLFTDAVRAVETVRSRAEVDPVKVAIAGGSQGGGISLAVAGLVPDIAAAMIDVPFLCDFPRAVTIGPRDPYGELVRLFASHRETAKPALETLRYFDGTCFAPRARAPALFSVALMDQTCPPSTVYAAFNAYGGTDKRIVTYDFNEHEGGGVFQEREQIAWLGQYA